MTSALGLEPPSMLLRPNGLRDFAWGRGLGFGVQGFGGFGVWGFKGLGV